MRDLGEILEGREYLDEGWWASLMGEDSVIFESSAIQEVYRGATENEKQETQDWEKIHSLYENDEIMPFEVRGYNRGGLLVVTEGIQGFVPVSHILNMPCGLEEEPRMTFLAEYVGKSLELKVIECDHSLERIVLSERAAQAGCGKRKQMFDSLKPGNKVQGTVTNITDFGVFIDLGGVEGLVHLSEISWGRVQHPAEVVEIGDAVEAIVLQVCEENCRVALSMKRLQTNPWEQLEKDIKLGDVLPATITSIMRFGVFARLEYGVEGLIHNSSLPNNEPKESLASLQPGQQVNVEVLHVDSERRRLGLGLVDSL